MDIDVLSELSIIPLPLDQAARQRILARMMVLWQDVKPINQPTLVETRTRDIQSIAAQCQLTLVNGKPVVNIPANLSVSWGFLTLGSFSHKAIRNLADEIVAAAQSTA